MKTPLVYLPRFRQAEAALETLRQRESWTRERIESHQLDAINRLWRHARAHCRHYERWADGDKLPPRFESLDHYVQTVPPTDKDAVRQNPMDFLSDQAEPGTWMRTGGSTGDPTRVYWGRSAHTDMQRAKYRGEQSFGLNVFDRKVFLWGHSGSFDPGVRGWMQRLRRPIEDRLRRRLRVSAYQLSPDRLERCVRKSAAFGPASLYGYASAIDLFSRTAQEYGIEFPTLKLAVLTAEPADEAMLNRVRENLRCKATIEYGSVECGLIAYGMADGRIRTRDDLLFVETVPAKDDRYEILVTVLNNPSFPLFRYRIGDMTMHPLRRDEAGFGYLSAVDGRANDFIVTATGRPIHSMAVKHVVEPWPQVRRFTAHQSGDGSMRVLLETPQPMESSLIGLLHRRLEALLEGYEVSLQTTPLMPGNRAGKHRWIISELAHGSNEVSSVAASKSPST